MKSTVPIAPGLDFTVTFALWDAGDSNADSLVLLDQFAFSGDALPAPRTTPL